MTDSQRRTLYPDFEPYETGMLDVGYGRGAFSAGLLDLVAAFVVDRNGLAPADVEAWATDLRSLGREYFFSLNRYIFRGTRAG